MQNETVEMVEVPRALLERVLDRLDSVENTVSDYREENEHDKATIRQDVAEARSAIESSDADEQANKADQLPIERLEEIGEHTHITESVERAGVIYEHFQQWSSKAPVGRTITDGLKRLVETATGESLYWKQIERACLKLESWSRGAITFENHSEKGWMLVKRSSSVSEGTTPSG